MTKKFIRKLFLVRGVGRCSVIATCGGAVIVAALVFRAMSGGEDVAAEVAATNSAKASASRTSRSPAQARKPSPSDIVAVVSGRKITRSQLGKECLKHYSKQATVIMSFQTLGNKDITLKTIRHTGQVNLILA